jgi:hypothetical protein
VCNHAVLGIIKSESSATNAILIAKLVIFHLYSVPHAHSLIDQLSFSTIVVCLLVTRATSEMTRIKFVSSASHLAKHVINLSMNAHLANLDIIFTKVHAESNALRTTL